MSITKEKVVMNKNKTIHPFHSQLVALLRVYMLEHALDAFVS